MYRSLCKTPGSNCNIHYPKDIQKIIDEYITYPQISYRALLGEYYMVVGITVTDKNNKIDSPYYWEPCSTHTISPDKLWFEYFVNICDITDVFYFSNDSFIIIYVNSIDNKLLVNCNYLKNNIPQKKILIIDILYTLSSPKLLI